MFPVVGIGASAGGLEAFGALLSALPSDTGMAFVVVSHLDPTHASALPAILARTTRMPVTEVIDQQTVEQNYVYVLPPGSDMTIEQGRLQLQPRAPQALHRPVDLFFRSLAEERRHQAIGVILSGTGSDGTLGVRAIKGGGGITFAQDDSAQQSGMPLSAISDGSVDFVLAPDVIAGELVRISRVPRLAHASTLTPAHDDVHLAQVLQSVRRQTRVDFTHYKSNTLRRRILRRMILQKTNELRDYAQLVRDRPTEAQALHDDLLIGVTSFFRDPEAFEALARTAFPQLVNVERTDEPIRVWVLGCSTGEEAYSLAMALTEFAEAAGRQVPIQIFASDVNAAGVKIARSGTYSGAIAQDVTPERLRRFFVQVDAHYRVTKTIRDTCVFSQHNVLTDPPFSRIDFVSCRNLLMYLEPVLQGIVIRNVHYALTPTGVLWLGHADSIGAHQDLFEIADTQHRIFIRRPGSVSHPTLRAVPSRWRPSAKTADRSSAPGVADLLKESDRVLLSHFAPAGVLVSPAMEILQYRGDVGPYVSPAPGKASLNVMQVLNRHLQLAVRAAIARAKTETAPVREEGVRITSPEGDDRIVSIEVVRVGSGPDGFLVLFDDGRALPNTRTHDRSAPQPSSAEGEQLTRVSKQLADTQSYLQTVIDEQEAAHQELEAAHAEAESANEELQSINEELETSKEEIQSANEELTTLNEELNYRNAELQQTNNDLINLLANTHLAVVFVGPDLHIRRFTAAAEQLLRLRPADLGRPLRDLRLPVSMDLEAHLQETLRTLNASEHDVQDDNGRWLSLRIRPYRTLDNQIEGAVIVWVDVDAMVRARLYAESIIATVRTPLIVLDERFAVVTANEAFYREFRTQPSDTEGRSLFQLGNRELDRPELRELLEEVLPLNHIVNDFQIKAMSETGSRKVWLLNARRLAQADHQHPLILLSLEDVSEREHAEGLRRQRIVELSAADQSKNEFLAMLAHELRNPLAPIRTTAQILGTPGVPAAAVESARVIIERQISNMTRLIDDLLDVARITQGKIELRLAPLDLTAVVRRARELVDRHLVERSQQVSLALPSDPLYVLGDAARLEQAFGNLLNNASKFSNQGGQITVRVESKPTKEGFDAFVTIRDQGMGIESQELPRIFDLFHQGAAAPRAPGLGVGLALVRRIVDLHGGRVSVQSAGRNQGSEFVVCLPLLHDVDDIVNAAPEARPPLVVGERILVVDDNVDAAESLMSLLRLWGHDARMAHDGMAALEIAPVFLPSVIFLDIGMAGMNGYDVARRLRRIPVLKRTLLVAVTGFGRDEDRRLADEAGFDHYVTKPVDPMFLPPLLARRQRDEGSSLA